MIFKGDDQIPGIKILIGSVFKYSSSPIYKSTLTSEPYPRLIIKSHGFEYKNIFCVIEAIIAKVGDSIVLVICISELRVVDAVVVYEVGDLVVEDVVLVFVVVEDVLLVFVVVEDVVLVNVVDVVVLVFVVDNVNTEQSNVLFKVLTAYIEKKKFIICHFSSI